MNTHIQRQTSGMPYLLKDKQCIQQITRQTDANIAKLQRVQNSLAHAVFKSP